MIFLEIAADLAFLYLSLFFIIAIRQRDFTFWPGNPARAFLVHFSFIYIFWLLLLYLLDFYKIPPFRNRFYFTYNIVIFVFLAGSLGMVYFYLQPPAVISPKTILVFHILLFALWLIVSRTKLLKIIKPLGEKVVLVGSFSRPQIKEIENAGFPLVKKFALPFNAFSFVEACQEADVVVFGLDFLRDKKNIRAILEAGVITAPRLNYPEFYGEVTGKIPLENIDETWFFMNISLPFSKLEKVIKRGFDIFFAMLGFLVLSIFFPIICLVLKLDSQGPVFYKQERVGEKGKIFTIYKFRTMQKNAEKTGPRWAKKQDQRVTTAGKFLRRTRIDEFPQFLNIFKGELSFVGPRPERPFFVEKLKREIPFYQARHLVKPGFTGWAQINHRYGSSIKDAREKLKYDLYYVRKGSFLMDLSIILKTIRIIFE